MVVAVSGPSAGTGTDPQDRDRHAAERSGYMGLEPGTRVEEIPVDRVFIGSCTNSRLEDLRAAAKVAKGHHVNPKVRAMVVPGSQAVKRAAEQEGLDRIFQDAGFRMAGVGMLDVSGHESGHPAAGRTLCFNQQPQFRRPAGPRRTHAPGQPHDGCRCCD